MRAALLVILLVGCYVEPAQPTTSSSEQDMIGNTPQCGRIGICDVGTELGDSQCRMICGQLYICFPSEQNPDKGECWTELP